KILITIRTTSLASHTIRVKSVRSKNDGSLLAIWQKDVFEWDDFFARIQNIVLPPPSTPFGTWISRTPGFIYRRRWWILAYELAISIQANVVAATLKRPTLRVF